MYMDGDIIDLSKLNVKIKDWTGWTQLLSIHIIKNQTDMNWKILTPKDENMPGYKLILKDEILPIYSHNATIKGFHGEVKYKYSLCHIDDISNEIILRAKIPYIMEWQMFLQMDSTDTEMDCNGYKIYTKSGFYNAGIYHLCSSDTKIDGSKELWK